MPSGAWTVSRCAAAAASLSCHPCTLARPAVDIRTEGDETLIEAHGHCLRIDSSGNVAVVGAAQPPLIVYVEEGGGTVAAAQQGAQGEEVSANTELVYLTGAVPVLHARTAGLYRSCRWQLGAVAGRQSWPRCRLSPGIHHPAACRLGCRARKQGAGALWQRHGRRRLHAAPGDGALRLWLHRRQLHW